MVRPDPDAARAQSATRPALHALTHGELSERDADELRVLKQLIRKHVGIECDGYKEKCLRRRLAVRMRARGLESYAQYSALLDTDSDERSRLADVVTINVSKFFRNPDAWSLLRAHVVPHLFGLDAGTVDIWSAGCAAGEEAYSLAILLLEYAERMDRDVSRFRILATDVDERALDAARLGEYPEFAFAETPDDTRARWFTGPDARMIRPEVQRLVRFETRDLLRDRYPARRHLILCRNVVIYFDRPAQETVFSGFHDALAEGGHLLLGKVETLFGPAATSFQSVSTRERLFRRA